jgi:hypothetical protein
MIKTINKKYENNVQYFATYLIMNIFNIILK